MKKFIFILVLLAVSFFVLWRFVFHKENKPKAPEPVSMAVSEHSSDFNKSLAEMLTIYYQLTEAFVNWDTAGVIQHTASFKGSVDSLKLDEMKKDSAIYPTVESYWGMIRSEIDGMETDQDLYAKREDLNMLSQQVFDLLRIVKYDAATVYYHECPMALNNYETSAFWLSSQGSDDDRRNPYLGLHDPKYGKAMLKCGSTRDSVNFLVKTSTEQ